MKDMLKKDIIKWLDARIIYHISDSVWVSLIQCVLKKIGMTIIENKNNVWVSPIQWSHLTIPPPSNINGIRSFISHDGFYRRFIKDFSRITKPLCQLLQHGVSYVFSSECNKAFRLLKQALISTPIVKTPYHTKSFELMCDTSDFAIEDGLGQRHNKVFHTIY